MSVCFVNGIYGIIFRIWMVGPMVVVGVRRTQVLSLRGVVMPTQFPPPTVSDTKKGAIPYNRISVKNVNSLDV